MDLADDCLAELDIVIASIHSGFNQDASAMTDRLLRAIACPWVDILGHPTGRIILKREPHKADMTRVIEPPRPGGRRDGNQRADRSARSGRRSRRDRHGTPARGSWSAPTRTAPAALGRLRWGVDGRATRLADAG